MGCASCQDEFDRKCVEKMGAEIHAEVHELDGGAERHMSLSVPVRDYSYLASYKRTISL
jgi:hypothetical protein